MISEYSEGGLRMIDLISFNKALKSTWVKKYLDPENHGKWKFFLTGNYNTMAVQLFSEETLIYLYIYQHNRCIYYGNLTTLVRDKLRGEYELY